MNINIVSAEFIIGSAIEQASTNSKGTATVPVEQLEILQDFLSSIDTSVSLLRVKKAFIEDRKNASVLAEQYFESLLVEARQQTVPDVVFEGLNKDVIWGEHVCNQIKNMLPLRDSIIEFIIAIYESAGDTSIVHSFMKKIIQLHYDHGGSFNSVDSDIYWKSDPLRWLGRECFLCVTAYLVKHEKFEQLEHLICTHYQVCCIDTLYANPPSREYRSVSFTSFNAPIPSINDEHRRAFLKIHNSRKHLLGELLIENMNEKYCTKQELVEMDTFLFFISGFHLKVQEGELWIPILTSYHTGELDVFKKAVSNSIFNRLLPLFKMKTEQEFLETYRHIISSTELHTILRRELYISHRAPMKNIFELNKQA